MNNTNAKKRFGKIFLAITGTILCVLLGLILVCNLVIIFKGSINPNRPPSLFSITPLVVMSVSMDSDAEGHIAPGDLVFIHDTQTNSLKTGDVISYMYESAVITHRMVEIRPISPENNRYITQGDTNTAPDKDPVSEEQIIGKLFFRIPKAGYVVHFSQTPLGMLIFIGIPLVLFIAFDIVRHRRNARGKRADI